MAPPNPVVGNTAGQRTDEAAATTTTTTRTATTTPTTPTTTASHASSVKGVLAGIHGLGEKVRGEFNSAVDGAAGDREGVARNRAVAEAGERERLTGSFAAETKVREGGVPGAGAGHGKGV
ncbi:uncharacterized protein L3040_008165 [Drepanopeziza brunnea f. sp. 'multigermtubi']|uniref:uncharacterized protein n=1 Tax=Drepanopeziza brunnea f. sp. 'multigermtubi' TaxID=698441 RepID=UPI0023A3F37C|nr:hypothetical protein L3040_008165 [Drepanopeziza brunnea f. sp. 'multigermtubi']